MSRGSQVKNVVAAGHEVKRGGAGRAQEAQENDKVILAAAQAVFVANPLAPIAEVAAKAGVGIAALYRRYPSKERLLATLCAQGQRVYIAETERALADSDSPWEAYARFLSRIVAQDTHSLSSRLAGTFRPTDEHAQLGERLQTLGEALFTRTQAAGAIRNDVTLLDVGFMLEGIAQVRLADDQRTAELRQRLVALLIDSLRPAAETTFLPGKAPTWEEQNARWIMR
ncbi:MAG TPA: TetR/AcrR family transcriptional regulator [Ktedonobacterales bacterium]|nr:TetR/AcrR family transcriptional regulator [Ktedonobacterales bacterium]